MNTKVPTAESFLPVNEKSSLARAKFTLQTRFTKVSISGRLFFDVFQINLLVYKIVVYHSMVLEYL
jgi:hypothetical protein